MSTRRERYREETRDEAKRIAFEQLAESGPVGVSVNAIAKRMGLTGPALYRYFANRDELLTELIRDSYIGLAEFADQAVRRTGSLPTAERIRQLVMALRDWGLAQPHRYLLLFGTPVPGYHAPADTIDLAHRVMSTFIELFAALPEPEITPSTLDRQLAELMRRRGGPHSHPTLVGRAVRAWTRLHGVLSLEIEGQFTPMGFNPELLYLVEIDALLAE